MRNGSDYNGRPFLDTEHLKYLFLSAEGRINRQRIWLGWLLLMLVMVPVIVLFAILIRMGGFLTVLGIILYTSAYVILLFSGVMMLIKRAHDRNHSGWYILLPMIPIIGIIWSVELYFLKGADGPNNYGADPRSTPDPRA